MGSVDLLLVGTSTYGWRVVLDGSDHLLDQLEVMRGLAMQHQVLPLLSLS